MFQLESTETQRCLSLKILRQEEVPFAGGKSQSFHPSQTFS